MKTILLIIFSTQLALCQMTNFGDMQINGNIAFHNDFINKGKVNETSLLRSVKGSYFQITDITNEYVSLDGGIVRVVLNGSPIIGLQNDKWVTVSEGNTTDYIQASEYEKLAIGSHIVSTQIFDVRGRYVGEKILPTFQKGVYIIIDHYSNGSKQSKKVSI